MEHSQLVSSCRHSSFPVPGLETKEPGKSFPMRFEMAAGRKLSRFIEMTRWTRLAGLLGMAGGFPLNRGSGCAEVTANPGCDRVTVHPSHERDGWTIRL